VASMAAHIRGTSALRQRVPVQAIRRRPHAAGVFPHNCNVMHDVLLGALGRNAKPCIAVHSNPGCSWAAARPYHATAGQHVTLADGIVT
jgi:hypothetical protein